MNTLQVWLKDFWFNHGTRIVARLKAFAWTAGCIGAISSIDYAAKNLGIFHLPEFATVGIGLMLAQITKWLNDNKNKYGNKGR
jgi:hypothetical protein